MDTGTRTGISYLANDGSDAVTAYRTSIRSIVTALEGKGVLYAQGALASRPTAGTVGRWYKPTDTGSEALIYWDDGTTWQTIGAGAPTDGSAATPSLRTLGSGSTQAAAGNHTHAAATLTSVLATTTLDNTTTTLADTGLSAVLAAGVTYRLEARLFVSRITSISQSVGIAWAGPTDVSGYAENRQIEIGLYGSPESFVGQWNFTSSAASGGSTTTVTGSSSSNDFMFIAVGFIKSTAGGTFKVRFAAGAGSQTVRVTRSLGFASLICTPVA